MQIELTADHGNTRGIPDLAPEVRERARVLRARLDALRRQPLPPDDQLPELTPEQIERIRAFALREDR